MPVLQSDISKVNDRAHKWTVEFSLLKSEYTVITRKHNKLLHPDMSNTTIPNIQSHKHLGIFISDDGTCDCHILNSVAKAWNRINLLHNLKLSLHRKSLSSNYFSFIRPLIGYAEVI